MKNLMKLTLLLCSALLLLSACSADAPSTNPQPTHEEQPITARLSLGLHIQPYHPATSEEGKAFRVLETQSFQYVISDGQNKYVLKDDGTPETSMPSKRGHLDREELVAHAAQLKFYLQIRRKADKQLVGSRYGTWEYASRNTKDWRLNGERLTLSGVNPTTDALQIRVVIGGKLDTDQNKILVEKPIYEELDLSKTTKISLPVPYASGWVDLTYDAANQLYSTKDNAKIKLSPLGAILVTTVRSTMTEGASLTGVRYVTNALAFEGELNLTGEDKIGFVGKGEKHTMPITDDVYYSTVYKFKSRLTLGRKPADRAIISWAMSSGKEKTKKWDSNSNQTGDLSTMILAPQTHVYAEGVLDGAGKPIAKPNYAVVPVMGTTGNFEDGKSAAINCELYNQPEQVLGYFAQYTVNSSGDGFDTSHEDAKVSLVNWTKVKPFGKGKELTAPNGEKAVYKLGDLGQAVYMLNFFGSPFALGQNGGYVRYYSQTDKTKGSISMRDRPQVAVTPQADGTVQIGMETRTQMNVFLPRTPKISYAIMGRNFDLNRAKSFHQSILHAEATFPKGVGKFPIGRVTMRSIYVGKYFIGTLYSPFLDFVAACDEQAWSDQRATPGLVERIFPAPGYYKSSSWNPKNPTAVADVDSEYPTSTERQEVGQRGVYWYDTNPNGYQGTSLMINQIIRGKHPEYNGAQWLTDLSIFKMKYNEKTGEYSGGQIIFSPNGGSTSMLEVNRDAKYMWQALLPIANKYQGDKATVPGYEH